MPPADQPPARAVALRYDPDTMAAPHVVAIGQGELAERILALARQHDIPIKRNPELVAVLATLDIGSAVPPALYQAIAEVIAFVYRLDRS